MRGAAGAADHVDPVRRAAGRRTRSGRRRRGRRPGRAGRAAGPTATGVPSGQPSAEARSRRRHGERRGSARGGRTGPAPGAEPGTGPQPARASASRTSARRGAERTGGEHRRVRRRGRVSTSGSNGTIRAQRTARTLTRAGVHPGDRRAAAAQVDDPAASSSVADCAGRRTASARRRRDPVGEPARADEEAGVADHAVLGPHRQALDVPPAHHRLPGDRLGERSRARAGPRRSRDSWVVVATYATSTPPGASACAAASRHSHGASMSSTTRSTVAGRATSRRQPLGQVADVERPGRVRRRRRTPRRWCARSSAKSARRSYERQPAAGRRPRAAARRSARRSPTPASTTRAPGKTSPIVTTWPASFGYTTAAPRGIDSTKSAYSGRSARYSTPPVLRTTTPSSRADQVVVRDRALVGVEVLPASSVTVCMRPLGSVSWTRSPARSGPRLTAGHALPRGSAPPTVRPRRTRSTSAVASTPRHRAAAVDDEVLGRRLRRAARR